MHSFHTTICPPGGDDDDFIPAEVSYEMRDLGVMGRHNENIQPVIRVVRFTGGRFDDLTDEQIERLEEEARRHHEGIAELAE